MPHEIHPRELGTDLFGHPYMCSGNLCSSSLVVKQDVALGLEVFSEIRGASVPASYREPPGLAREPPRLSPKPPGLALPPGQPELRNARPRAARRRAYRPCTASLSAPHGEPPGPHRESPSSHRESPGRSLLNETKRCATTPNRSQQGSEQGRPASLASRREWQRG